MRPESGWLVLHRPTEQVYLGTTGRTQENLPGGGGGDPPAHQTLLVGWLGLVPGALLPQSLALITVPPQGPWGIAGCLGPRY